MHSSLALAQDEKLTMVAVLTRFDLGGSRLGTLFTCESGLIDVRDAPNKFLGLPAEFMFAGAPVALGALWEANDLATLLPKEALYRNNRTKKCP